MQEDMGQARLPDQILKELSHIGFARVTDYLAVEDNTLVVRSTGELDEDQGAAIAAIERTSTGLKVKFYDKLKALELLGKQYGMFESKNTGQIPKNNLLQAILDATKEEMNQEKFFHFSDCGTAANLTKTNRRQIP